MSLSRPLSISMSMPMWRAPLWSRFAVNNLQPSSSSSSLINKYSCATIHFTRSSSPPFPSLNNQRLYYRNYTTTSNMASATSFYDFKPLDSMSLSAPPLSVHIYSYPALKHTTSFMANRLTQLTQSSQSAARRFPSPTTRARSSSSSTLPPSAASPLSTPVLRSSGPTSRASTPMTLSFSASPATSSAARSPAPTMTFRSSASSTTA